MFSPTNGFHEDRISYDIPERGYIDYDTGQETGTEQPQIFVDKSHHVTNYTYNIKVTGVETTDLTAELKPAIPTFVMESEFSNRLTHVLDEIEDVLDEPGAFEQKLSTLLSVLDKLYERRLDREIYFSDLLSLLHMCLVSIECGDLKKDGVDALRDAVSSLPHRITEQKLRELRNILRNSGIDLLKPLKSHVDTESILREICGDEITI